MTSSTPRRGLFIAVEGGEGTGKSTLIRGLARTLTERGETVTSTREPGSNTTIGARLRSILLDPETGKLDPRTESLLFAADRAEHVARIVRPALDRGEIVITDRYLDSSVSYQGAGNEEEAVEIHGLSLFAAHGLLPDLTVLLDLDPVQGLARAGKEEFGKADRWESERLEFHTEVREGFLRLARAEPDRYLVVDASGTADDVFRAVLPEIEAIFAKR